MNTVELLKRLKEQGVLSIKIELPMHEAIQTYETLSFVQTEHYAPIKLTICHGVGSLNLNLCAIRFDSDDRTPQRIRD